MKPIKLQEDPMHREIKQSLLWKQTGIQIYYALTRLTVQTDKR